jgi:hypothetical protein
MSLFRRKNSKQLQLGSPQVASGRPKTLLTHRFTKELACAESLAIMLANSRAAATLEVADLLAGIYIYGWERLCKYWDDDDQDEAESFLRQICQISTQRWHYWMQFYDKKRRNGEEQHSWLPSWKRKKKQSAEKTLTHSTALALLLKRAEGIAPFRDTVGGLDIPILTSECVLLCIVRGHRSEISRKLASSGLNISKLEKEALFSRRAKRE